MCRGKKKCSSFEVLLSTLVIALFVVCAGLIAVSWFATYSDKNGSDSSFGGTLIISEGANFTDDLQNPSSVQFKALAFDTELLISELFGQSSLSDQFRSCRVTEFSKGSVLVQFTLLFREALKVTVVQEEFIAAVESHTGDGLVINASSIHITEVSATQPSFEQEPMVRAASTSTSTSKTTTTTPGPAQCPDGQKACADDSTCVPLNLFCDGEPNCPDASDESHSVCATACDGQFVLSGPGGFFHSKNFPLDYDSGTICRWIIRVDEGQSIKITFETFHTEEQTDTLRIYEGTGPDKKLTYSLSGSSPGSIWIFSHHATLEFSSDLYNNQQGFNASYHVQNLDQLSNAQRINCSFEESLCFWRNDADDDDGDWIRARGASLPSLTGPSSDHTYANQSGYYIVTQKSPGTWEKVFRIKSLPLAPESESVCLRFWYHMYGEEVFRLQVKLDRNSSSSLLFQKEGNYGDNWNYGQITISDMVQQTIVFEARKLSGMLNDIALDDLSMTPGPCGPSPPDPTPVPKPTTPPPIPADCGGPFHLYEPNTTFSSPNFPHGYGNGASCVWVLHASEGKNIQLHLQDFALEASYDMLEVRDGVEPNSKLLAVLTGEQDFPDLFSSSSQMMVMFFTDSSGIDRGFLANFSTGLNLGQPEPCESGQYQCRSGVCVSGSGVCDGVMDCADGSDEAQCVNLITLNSTGTPALKIQIQQQQYTACSTDWNPQLSTFYCQYLGYRSGDALFVPASEEEAPFVIVSLSSNGSLNLSPSEKCSSERYVSLQCNNQPCGKQKVRASPEGYIVGGQDAPKGAWPWMASLSWRGRHVCGGTLIDSQWIITAGHCVYGKNIHLQNWNVVLGLHAQYESDTSQRQYHQVDQIIMNENYNKQTKDSDIALMHLRTRVNYTDFIQSVCLPDPAQTFPEGRKCVITGWGRLTEGGSVADVLQQAVVPLVSNSVCQDFLPEYTITERMVCAGYTEGGVDTCQGDSGGPLLCEEDGFWVLVGVTSFGVGCARPDRPSVYVLLTHFTPWILETRRLHGDWDGARRIAVRG